MQNPVRREFPLETLKKSELQWEVAVYGNLDPWENIELFPDSPGHDYCLCMEYLNELNLWILWRIYLES